MPNIENTAAPVPKSPEKMQWVERLAGVMERMVPDAISTSIVLMVGLVALALAIGTPLSDTVDAYYRGLCEDNRVWS